MPCSCVLKVNMQTSREIIFTHESYSQCLTRSVAATFGRHGMPPLAWRLWLLRVVVHHQYTKFEVHRPWHSEDMGHDVYQH